MPLIGMQGLIKFSYSFGLGFKSNLKKINKKIFLFELIVLGLLYRIKQTI